MQEKKLSRRLLAVASLLPQCGCIADVGCDHGLLGLHLLQTGKCQTLCAVDISEKSLQKAKKLYREHGVEGRVLIERLDGLPQGSAQAAVIAGIGGHISLRIIENGLDVAMRLKCLVLQPADDAAQLRRGLMTAGFDILREKIIFEGRYFPVMAVQYDGIKRPQLDDVFYEIGPYNMMCPDKTVINYVDWRIRIWEKAVKQPAQSERGQANQQTAQHLIRELKKWREENLHAADA